MNRNLFWAPNTAGGAAALGGLCWMIKAGVILVTGDQPPVLFAVGPLLFALGVIGLAQMLPVPRGRLGVGAQILAAIAGLATLGSLVMTRGVRQLRAKRIFHRSYFLASSGPSLPCCW